MKTKRFGVKFGEMRKLTHIGDGWGVYLGFYILNFLGISGKEENARILVMSKDSAKGRYIKIMVADGNWKEDIEKEENR
jgi:hypothetical protein